MTIFARVCRPALRPALGLLAVLAIIVTALVPGSSADTGMRRVSLGHAVVGDSVYPYDRPTQQSPAQAVDASGSGRDRAAGTSAEAWVPTLPTTTGLAAETAPEVASGLERRCCGCCAATT